jgi:ferritin-like metal-binding protein YciE
MECAMTAKDKNLNDLFLDTLKDIYFAEKQILKALPKMAKAAQSDKLRAAFENIMARPRARSNGWSRSSN